MDGCELALELFEQLSRDELLHLDKISTSSILLNGVDFLSDELRGDFHSILCLTLVEEAVDRTGARTCEGSLIQIWRVHCVRRIGPRN